MSESAATAEKDLRITEIFHSLQGESRPVGLPTAFIRLTGCPLRCTYCDTEYAFHGGEIRAIDDIVEQVVGYDVQRVTVTGGEPLAQRGVHQLMQRLCDAQLAVSLETSGALSVAQVDPRVVKVLDLKTPDSGEVGRNDWSNLACLQPTDQVKFVICSRQDYEWARTTCDEHGLYDRVTNVLFSPSHEQQSAAELAQWMIDDRLKARLQTQLHKQLWGDVQGR